MSYLKPQTPLQHKDGDYFYPLTTIDQIIMEDGVTRLNGADLVSVNTDDAPEGEIAGINADTLGGYSADTYIRQDSSKALLSVNLNEIVNGTASLTNADMLGNVSAEEVFSELDSKTSMELLWENASPSSAFAAQQIALDLSEYKFVCITTSYGTAIVEIGGPGDIVMTVSAPYNNTYKNLYLRSYSANKTHVIVGKASYIQLQAITNPPADFNTGAVPYKIYGIKGGMST